MRGINRERRVGYLSLEFCVGLVGNCTLMAFVPPSSTNHRLLIGTITDLMILRYNILYRIHKRISFTGT